MKRLIFSLSLAALSAQAIGASIYPMEGGDLRRSSQAQSLTHVVAPLDIVWSSVLCHDGDVQSNPIVLQDRIVQTFDYSTVCVSRFDGKLIWRAGAFGHQWNPGSYDATRDLLYISSWIGSMVALRASDGTEAWHYYEGNSHGCSNLGACTYWQDKVYVGTGTGRLVCLDANTHSILWTLNLGILTGIDTPAIDNGELYVGTLAGKIYRVDATTGAVTWQVNSPGTCYGSAVSLDDAQLYVMTTGGKVECHSRASGALVWSFQTGSWTLSNLSVGPLGVYCSSDDRNIYRLDPVTGTPIWSHGFVGNFARSGPFCHGDMVVASGCTGIFYGQNTGDGSDAWTFNHTGGNDFTEFAEADGLLYVTTLGGVMYCLRPQNAAFPPTVTASPTLTVTVTPTQTSTRTQTVTASSTPTLTATPTFSSTATPSSSSTSSPTTTDTITPSDTPTSSATVTPSSTPTPTASITPSSTRTSTPSVTQTITSTASPSPTSTATATASITLTPTRSATASHTPTSSSTPTVSQTYTQTTVPSPTPLERDGEGKKDPGDGGEYAAPNPVHGGPCHVVYRMKGPGNAKVRIYQASGDPVGMVEERHNSAGVHSCEVSTQRYAPGVYFYRADLSYDDGGQDKLPLKKLLVLKAR